jgi:hypothetical protein
MEPLDSLEPLAEKKPKRSNGKTLVFYDTWACRFAWVEFIIGDDGLVFQVRSTIYSKILRKPKLLALKLDTLQKHISHQKAIVLNLGVVIGDWYYCNDATHYKNERAFIGQNSETIMTLVQ